mgnify:CR=1 FL=1
MCEDIIEESAEVNIYIDEILKRIMLLSYKRGLSIMHILMSKGDFIYNQWDKDGYNNFSKKIHELRVNGYRKVDQDFGFLDYHEYYKKKGKKKIITVTLRCY